MFEPSNTEFLSESLPGLLRRKSREWKGVSKWPSTLATVTSCEWNADGEGGGSYKTKFTYSVEGIYYTGKFSQARPEADPPFREKDTLTVQYHPQKPNKCFYVHAFTSTEIVYLWIIVILAIILIHRLFTSSVAWPGFFSGDGD